MSTKVNELKKDSVKATKILVSEHEAEIALNETKKLAEKTIGLSEDELNALAKKYASSKAIAKTRKNKSFWSADAKAENGRSKLRRDQISLSEDVIYADSLESIKVASKMLYTFYKASLISFDTYTNISKKENELVFNKITDAFNVMKKYHSIK